MGTVELRNRVEEACPVAARHEVDKLMQLLGEEDASQTVLMKAEKLIHGDRLEHYGHPSINFERIAQSWSQYTSKDISPFDVCMMMILLKTQRCAEGFHEDSIIDIGGYAALAAILAGADEL